MKSAKDFWTTKTAHHGTANNRQDTVIQDVPPRSDNQPARGDAIWMISRFIPIMARFGTHKLGWGWLLPCRLIQPWTKRGSILGECEIVIPQIISEERPVGLFSSIRESSNGTCGIPKFGRDRRKAREVTKARGQFNAHTTGTDILIVVHWS